MSQSVVRVVTVLLGVGLAAICTAARGEQPRELLDQPQEALGRLLLVRGGEAPVRLFETAAAPAEESPVLQEVEIAAMLLPYLFAGDELVIPPAASVLLLSYRDATRQQHYGACRLRIEEAGITVVEPGDTPPVIEQVEAFEQVLIVGDREDAQMAGPVIRGDPMIAPVALHPVDTAVPPGRTALAWSYLGPSATLTVALESAGRQELQHVLKSNCSGCLVWVRPGEQYTWTVAGEDGPEPERCQFSVLSIADWRDVRTALYGCGIYQRDVAAALGEHGSAADLAYLISVCQYYGMDWEAMAATEQLRRLNSAEGQ